MFQLLSSVVPICKSWWR